MYIPQIERLQRRLVQKLWVNIVYYYSFTVATIRELPHHLRLLWDGAFSFDDIHNPNASLHDDLGLTTILTSTSYSDDMKSGQLSFDPSLLSLNYSEELNAMDSQGLAAASGTYPYPLTLEPTSPATVPPMSLSLLVLLLVGVLIIYRPVRKEQATRGVSDSAVQSQECHACDDRDEQRKAMTRNVEQLQSTLTTSNSLHQENLERLTASHNEAAKDLNHTISILTESTNTLTKDVETLRSENQDQKKTIYDYTQEFKQQNEDKRKGLVRANAVPSTPAQDSKIADLTGKVSELQNKTVGLKEELDSEKAQAKDSRSHHLAEKADLQKQINSLQKEKASAINAKDKALQENTSTRKHVTELENQIKTLKAAQSEHRCEDPGHKILATLNRSEIHKNELLVNENATLKITLAERDAELIDVKGANKSLAAEDAARIAAEGRLQYDLESLQGGYKTLQVEKDDLQQQYKSMRDDLLQLDTDYTEAEQKKAKLEDENSTLKLENSALKKSKESLEVGKTWLEAEKDSLQDQKDALENEKSVMGQTMGLLQQEKATLQTEKNALETAKVTLETDKATLEAEKTTLKQRVDSLQYESATFEAEKGHLNQRLKDLEIEIEQKNALASQTLAINIEEEDAKDKKDPEVIPDSPFASTPTVSSHAEAIKQQESIDYLLNYDVFPGKPHFSFHWAPRQQRTPRGVAAQRRKDKFKEDLTYAPPSGPLLEPKVKGKAPVVSGLAQVGVPTGPASSMPRPSSIQSQQPQQSLPPTIFGDRKFEAGNYGSYGNHGSYRNYGRR